MMNKVYLIELREVDWDQYNGFVVVAKDEAEALEICGIRAEKGELWDNKFRDNVELISVIADSKLKSQVILESFKAG